MNEEENHLGILATRRLIFEASFNFFNCPLSFEFDASNLEIFFCNALIFFSCALTEIMVLFCLGLAVTSPLEQTLSGGICSMVPVAWAA